jgi:hypothetical protein
MTHRDEFNSIIEFARGLSVGPEQRCLHAVMQKLRKNPSLTVMTGPADKAYDTRHFWLQDRNGKVIDPTRTDYPHHGQGKPFDLKRNSISTR